jgi:hypothetical protein
MATWPTDDLTVSALDGSSDSPAQARPELHMAVLKLKTVLAAAGTGSNQVLLLDASGKAPAAIVGSGNIGSAAVVPAAQVGSGPLATSVLLTLASIRRSEGYATNSAQVSVTNSDTLVCAIDLGSVAIGDRIMVHGLAPMTKGVTSGLCLAECMLASGTAYVRNAGHPTLATVYGAYRADVPPSTSFYGNLSGMFRVESAGTLSLGLFAYAQGTAVVGEGQASFYGMVLRGS